MALYCSPAGGTCSAADAALAATFALAAVHAGEVQQSPGPAANSLAPGTCPWCCAVQHEKIIRGVAVGLALVHYGREEAAEGMIEQMTRELVSGTWLWHDVMPVKRTAADIGIMAQTGWPEGHAALRAAAEQHTCCWTSACLLRAACRLASPAACTHSCVPLSSLLAPPQDPILRYGGMFVTGLAYCGTSNNAAIQRLLHFAVSGACGGCSRVASGGHLPPLLHPNVDLWVAPNGSVACCNTVATVHWALLPHSANGFVCFNLCLPHHLPHKRTYSVSHIWPACRADVANDVRRAAVLNLGFVLASSPEQCPKIVSLLAESYNPHVR